MKNNSHPAPRDSTNTLLEKPFQSTLEAAITLGCSPATLRMSRVTGTLLSKAAPRFVKRGRKVDYKREELEKFIAQFPDCDNTAQAKNNP